MRVTYVHILVDTDGDVEVVEKTLLAEVTSDTLTHWEEVFETCQIPEKHTDLQNAWFLQGRAAVVVVTGAERV